MPRPADIDGELAGGGDLDYDPDIGLVFGAGVGTYFTENIRGDITYTYLWFEDDDAQTPGGPFGLRGEVMAPTFLANAYYEFDFDQGEDGITPWVGAGLGFTVIDYDNLGGPNATFDESETVFTGALHLGADIPLGDSVNLGGRFSLAYVDGHSVTDTTGAIATINIDSAISAVFLIALRFNLQG